jgi:hypothetical protein
LQISDHLFFIRRNDLQVRSSEAAEVKVLYSVVDPDPANPYSELWILILTKDISEKSPFGILSYLMIWVAPDNYNMYFSMPKKFPGMIWIWPDP